MSDCLFQENRARKVRSNKLNKSLSGEDNADESINESLTDIDISLGEASTTAVDEKC